MLPYRRISPASPEGEKIPNSAAPARFENSQSRYLTTSSFLATYPCSPTDPPSPLVEFLSVRHHLSIFCSVETSLSSSLRQFRGRLLIWHVLKFWPTGPMLYSALCDIVPCILVRHCCRRLRGDQTLGKSFPVRVRMPLGFSRVNPFFCRLVYHFEK